MLITLDRHPTNGVFMSSKDLVQFTHDLNGQTKAIQSMLPAGMDSRRFLRTVVNTVSTHPQSDRLLSADRQSLFSACQRAAGDGLLLDGRESTLIVFRDKKARTEVVNYIPMVQGLVKLARNSGEIANITAELVYSNDSFQYRPGVDEQPAHEPDWFGERGEPIGVYAVITTHDSEKIVSVMPKKRLMVIAGSGRNVEQYDPNKGTHFEEWWKKAAIKNVLKYAPKSTYLESALSSESTTSFDIPDFKPEKEKDITPDPPTAEEIECMVSSITDAIKKATSRKQLIALQDQISELPVDNQEALVIRWNDQAVKIKEAEDIPVPLHSPATDSGLDEHHLHKPETGEILEDTV